MFEVPGSYEQKEILSLQRELHETADEYEKYAEVRQFYKDKLVELGVMRKIKKTTCKTVEGHFTKL